MLKTNAMCQKKWHRTTDDKRPLARALVLEKERGAVEGMLPWHTPLSYGEGVIHMAGMGFSEDANRFL